MSTVPFTLRIDEEIKSRLEEEAKTDERSAASIASRAIKQYLDNRDHQRLELPADIQEADKGEFISSQSMRAWIASWGTDDELSPPEVDVFLKQK